MLKCRPGNWILKNLTRTCKHIEKALPAVAAENQVVAVAAISIPLFIDVLKSFNEKEILAVWIIHKIVLFFRAIGTT
jgi:hypothetical protein